MTKSCYVMIVPALYHPVTPVPLSQYLLDRDKASVWPVRAHGPALIEFGFRPKCTDITCNCALQQNKVNFRIFADPVSSVSHLTRVCVNKCIKQRLIIGHFFSDNK